MKPKKQSASPIDGGWGWMIVLGNVIIGFFLQSTLLAFGVLVDHLTHGGVFTHTAVSGVPALLITMSHLLAPVSSQLSSFYSHQTLSLLGILITCLGLALCSITVTMHWFYICYGILGGIGHSLTVPRGAQILREYFSTRRSAAQNISSLGTTLSLALAPLLLYVLCLTLTTRGALLVWSGILLNAAIGAMLYSGENKIKSTLVKPQAYEPTLDDGILEDIYDQAYSGFCPEADVLAPVEVGESELIQSKTNGGVDCNGNGDLSHREIDISTMNANEYSVSCNQPDQSDKVAGNVYHPINVKSVSPSPVLEKIRSISQHAIFKSFEILPEILEEKQSRHDNNTFEDKRYRVRPVSLVSVQSFDSFKTAKSHYYSMDRMSMLTNYFDANSNFSISGNSDSSNPYLSSHKLSNAKISCMEESGPDVSKPGVTNLDALNTNDSSQEISHSEVSHRDILLSNSLNSNNVSSLQTSNSGNEMPELLNHENLKFDATNADIFNHISHCEDTDSKILNHVPSKSEKSDSKTETAEDINSEDASNSSTLTENHSSTSCPSSNTAADAELQHNQTKSIKETHIDKITKDVNPLNQLNLATDKYQNTTIEEKILDSQTAPMQGFSQTPETSNQTHESINQSITDEDNLLKNRNDLDQPNILQNQQEEQHEQSTSIEKGEEDALDDHKNEMNSFSQMISKHRNGKERIYNGRVIPKITVTSDSGSFVGSGKRPSFYHSESLVEILRNPIFLIAALSTSLKRQVYYSYIIYLPAITRLIDDGQPRVPYLLTVVAIFEFLSRMAATSIPCAVSRGATPDKRYSNVMSGVLCCLSIIVLISATNFAILVVSSVIFGSAYGAILFVDHSNIAQLPHTYWMSLVFTVVISWVIYPMQGWTLDTSASHIPVGIVLLCLSVTSLTLEVVILVTRRRWKRTANIFI